MISQCGRASEMMPRSFEKKFIINLQVCENNAYLCSAQALKNGSIAQLVQSICLTSRGSGVRIPLLPQRMKTTSGRLFLFYVCLTLQSRGPKGPLFVSCVHCRVQAPAIPAINKSLRLCSASSSSHPILLRAKALLA